MKILYWHEMSYYQIDRESNETISDKLSKENLSCRSSLEWSDLSYRKFEEDDYSDESEA